MELIGKYQIEVTTIVIRKNDLMNKRRIDFFKRLIFFSQITDVIEYSYLCENYYTSCSVLVLQSGEWLKVKDDYNDLKKAHSNWYEHNTQSNDSSIN